ncbi:MAG: hypothetical protein CME06_15330 [Gemmatimonadetes bacterium]|nr:hypothetical protein [Gemmatimonadota bacterium]
MFLDRDELRALARQVLGAGGEFSFLASGRSMHPAIRDGERVKVAPLGEEGPIVGEVVLYEGAGGRMLLHRVVELGEEGRVQLRGDARPSMDEWVERERVVGRGVALGD